MATVLAGCGGVKTYPVKGTISYPDGTPITCGGMIMFTSADPEKKGSSRGIIKEDGTFRMGTFDQTDGVPEGTYKVSLVPTPLRNPNKPPPGWPPIHIKYTHYEKSGLEYTVTRGKNEWDVVVEK